MVLVDMPKLLSTESLAYSTRFLESYGTTVLYATGVDAIVCRVK
jgi:hypothetical protein